VAEMFEILEIPLNVYMANVTMMEQFEGTPRVFEKLSSLYRPTLVELAR
jgi:hypothetical protein